MQEPARGRAGRPPGRIPPGGRFASQGNRLSAARDTGRARGLAVAGLERRSRTAPPLRLSAGGTRTATLATIAMQWLNG